MHQRPSCKMNNDKQLEDIYSIDMDPVLAISSGN